MPSLHILHVLPYLESGGTEQHVLTLITALRRLGLADGEVLGPPGPFAKRLSDNDIILHTFTGASANFSKSFREFRRIFAERAAQVDLVHVHGAPELLLFAASVRSIRKPRLLTVHGFHGQGAGVSYRFAAFFGNRLARAVICVTGSEEKLLRAAGMQPRKLHRIYNGVADPAAGSASSAATAAVDAAGAAGASTATFAAATSTAVRIAFIGRLAPVKGVDVLLQAMAKLIVEQQLSVVLDIYGTGPQEADLQALAGLLGIAPHVTFHGYCSDAVARLAAADIFCLPSREDMGPLVCAEAMAQGKPVVSTLVGGIPEMVAANETGLLVPADDVTALAEALTVLVSNPQIRRVMGAAGRRRYEALFTQEQMARSTYSVYKSLLSA